MTNPTCLAVSAGGGAIFNGTFVVMNPCDASDPLQDFSLNVESGLITHNPTGLCLDAGSTVVPPDFCVTGNHSSWTICDPSAPIEARAADIVARISLSDKYLALGTGTPFLTSIDMLPNEWWNEATHGER